MIRDRYTLGVIAGAAGYSFLDAARDGRVLVAAVMFCICAAAITQATRLALGEDNGHS